MLNKGIQLCFIIFKSLFSLECFIKAEKSNNNIGLMPESPSVWRFILALAVGVPCQFRLELFCTWKGPRRGSSRMWPKTRCVSPVAHVTDVKEAVRVTQLHLRFKVPIIHHPGPEVISDQDDMCAF